MEPFNATGEVSATLQKPFLSFPEVQGYLGIKSRKTLLKYIREGRLHGFKLGGHRWRFASSEIQKFIEAKHKK